MNMKIPFALPQTMLKGDIIPLHTSDKGHWNAMEPAQKSSDAESFYSMLVKSVEQVNDKQIHAEQLGIKAVAEPGSVQMHDVLIATENARMSLTFAKTVMDQAVKTYRELTNLR